MSKPGIEDYSFSAKHQWRKAVWREIARRVDYKRKARVLYLAGEQDLDRAQAEKNGFDPRNMIAVEIDEGRAKSLRKNGVTTINANLLDVLHNWPEHKKVGVVVADFCFGFEKDAIDLYDSLINPALRDACILVNFQRGRDPSTNKIRKALGGRKLFSGNLATEQIRDTDVDEKHRAFQFLFWHAYETAHIAMHGETDSFSLDMMGVPEFAAMVGLLFSPMRPTFRTYRSGFALRMDSAVFNHGAKGARIPKMLEPGMRTICEPFNPRIKRQISAALAVQTVRKAASVA